MGVTPELVSGAWVGGEDRSVHFEKLAQGSGSSMALPIWALYMQKVYSDKSLRISKSEFEAPSDFDINLNCKDVDNNPVNFKPIEGED
jgi:penicillin-binding protein 1A